MRESLALRDRVVDFAADAQGLDATALKERFLNTFAKAGRDARRRQPVIDLPFKRPGNLPRRRSEAADIDLADIQGNVLRGYTFPTAAYIFLRIDDARRARALMSRRSTEVATAEPWQDGPPATATHAAFTYSGLRDPRGAPRDPRLLPV